MKKAMSGMMACAAVCALGLAGARAQSPTNWLWYNVTTTNWYAFGATNSTLPGEIGMQAWLDKPAGRLGRPARDNGRFVYNGSPIKFWGFNLGAEDAALPAADNDAMAAFYEKYGVNLIRFHKILEHWSALRPTTGPHNFALLDESPGGGMAKFDYTVKRLKDSGIYLNLSPSWHFTISEGDKADVPYWREFYDSYTRGAPAFAQIQANGRAAKGAGRFSFDAINNGTNVQCGIRAYGVNGQFTLDLTRTNAPAGTNGGTVALLGQTTLAGVATNWASFTNAVDFGTGYDYLVVVAWSQGFMQGRKQRFDNVFLGATTNVLADGAFANLQAAPPVAASRLRTQADATNRWHLFSPSVWKADTGGGNLLADGGAQDHPNRPSVNTENGFGSIPAFLYFLEEFQELKIKQLENLLNHTNTLTGVKLAREPAVAMVEMHNETSIYYVDSYLKNAWMTTLRQRACQEFCAFLRTKYTNHAALAAAWNPGTGQNGLDHWAVLADDPATACPEAGFPNQRLDLDNIPPVMLPNSPGDAHPGRWARARDTGLFYYLKQREYYRRFRDRVRATGYDGELIASNWGASGYTHNHYLNLEADADVGMIDRHRYAGFMNHSMISVPGCEFLAGASVCQTANRPFMYSEWSQNWANPCTIESRLILAAFGFGLQGWDAATQLPGGRAFFNSKLGFDYQYFNPNVAALYPFILRQIHRGDVAEAPALAERPVHVASLTNDARLGFVDASPTEFGLAVKESDKIHRRTPAVAKCQVRWTTAYEEGAVFPIANYRETTNNETYYDASGGQLSWREAAATNEFDGHITVNTPGTQGAAGFFDANDAIELNDLVVRFRGSGRRFAAVYATARDKGQTLATASNVLVLAMARARNTGMQYDAAGGKLLNEGTAPVLMEPVDADVTFKRSATLAVTKLDHDGMRAGSVPVDQANKKFVIDGAAHRTPYYVADFTAANRIVNPEFDAALIGQGSWADSQRDSGTGWIIHNGGSRWNRQAAADSYAFGDDSGASTMVQMLAPGATGNRPFSFRVLNNGPTTLRLAVWGVNEACKANLYDANPPKKADYSAFVGTVLYTNGTLGAATDTDWRTVSGTVNLGASGYQYLVIKAYSSGCTATKTHKIDKFRLE